MEAALPDAPGTEPVTQRPLGKAAQRTNSFSFIFELPWPHIRGAQSRVTASSAHTTTLVAIVGEVLKQVLDEQDLSGRVEPA